jgi:Porin subfamily
MFKNARRVAAHAVAAAFIVGFAATAKAEVDHVRVCSLYGAGFWYVPGSDTCLKVNGFVRSEYATDKAWGWNVQGLGYAGSVHASSFGNSYDTNAIGGRGAFGLRLPNYFRVQADLQGEGTGDYCKFCRDRSYLAGGVHLDWNAISNVDVGLFGGFATVKPTFSTSRSDYGFGGLELRYFTKNWLVGGQIGHLDLNSGPGTVTDTTFVEGRMRISLGGMLKIHALDKLGVGLSFGRAYGKIANTSINIDSTQWSAFVNYQLLPNVSAFVGYHGFENNVEPIGTVWKEQLFKVGVKVDWGTEGSTVPIEPVVPLPTVLRAIATF